MACTGYEDMGNYQKPILFPGKITENLIMDYANKKDFKLGVVQPHSNQIKKEFEKWNLKNINADVHSSSPYGNCNVSTDQNWIDVKNSFEQFKPDLVYLNCMGMSSDHKNYIHENYSLAILQQHEKTPFDFLFLPASNNGKELSAVLSISILLTEA